MKVDEIPATIGAFKSYATPIVCNEDDGRGKQAARLLVENGASWGLMLNDLNQRFPLTFHGAADERVVYVSILALTNPSSNAR